MKVRVLERRMAAPTIPLAPGVEVTVRPHQALDVACGHTLYFAVPTAADEVDCTLPHDGRAVEPIFTWSRPSADGRVGVAS